MKPLSTCQTGPPEDARSKRQAAISPDTQVVQKMWREQAFAGDPEAWVFASENGTSPMRRDNIWRRVIRSLLREVTARSNCWRYAMRP